VIDVDSGIDATIAAAITGSAGLTKLGGGRLVLAGTNTYSGTTEVTAGTLDLTAGASLAGGVDNSATFISAGTVQGNLTNSGTATNFGTIGGNVTNSGNFAQFASGIINGSLTNTGAARLAGQLDGDIANIAGTIQLTGGLTGIGRLTQGGGASFSLVDVDNRRHQPQSSGWVAWPARAAWSSAPLRSPPQRRHQHDLRRRDLRRGRSYQSRPRHFHPDRRQHLYRHHERERRHPHARLVRPAGGSGGERRQFQQPGHHHGALTNSGTAFCAAS
jgi:autotransporter-associated beta strand protein